MSPVPALRGVGRRLVDWSGGYFNVSSVGVDSKHYGKAAVLPYSVNCVQHQTHWLLGLLALASNVNKWLGDYMVALGEGSEWVLDI